jgi:uncharacterized protein
LSIYLDSSALVKLVLDEPGAEQSWELVGTGELVTSRITWVESRSALARREREAPMHEQLWQLSRQDLDRIWRKIRVVELTPALALLAGDYAEAFALRGYDAVQLASAESARSAVQGDWLFLCFDRRLNVAASLLGLELPRWEPA